MHSVTENECQVEAIPQASTVSAEQGTKRMGNRRKRESTEANMEIHNRQKCARCRAIQQMTINRSKQEEFKSYNRIMMEGNVHNEFKSSV